MSSISLDASGQRGVNLSLNDPARTAATIPTKADDDLSVNVGGAGEITIAILPSAVLKRVKKGDQEYLLLKLQGSFQASVANVAREEGKSGMWPHAFISARKWKDGEGYLDDAEPLGEPTTLGELLGVEA